MRTVYGVTEGSYSDYVVRVLFDSIELAEEHAKQLDDGQVAEFTLLSDLPTRCAVYWRHAKVHKGEVIEDHEWSDDMWSYGNTVEMPRPLMVCRVQEYSYTLPVSVMAHGTDKNRVDKAFYDKVAQVRAEQLEASS